MAALLVAIAIMGILMSAAMPVWRQQAQREKEAELIFRGEQWARAIHLFQRKFGSAFPPNVNVLVEQKFIRKRYKDPITNDDFQPVFQGAQTPGGVPGQSTPGMPTPRGGSPNRGGGPPQPNAGPRTPPGATPGVGPSAGAQVGQTGGILGFTSKSKDTSIRLYQGRSKYNEWVFVYRPPGSLGGERSGGPGNPQPGFPGGQGPGGGRRGGGSFPPGGPGIRPPGGMPGPAVGPPGTVPPSRPPG